MLRTLLYIIKLFTTHRSFQKNKELRNSSPDGSRFFSTHDKRKLASLKSEARKGIPTYSKVLLLKSYEILRLTKDQDNFSLKNELDNLIKMLIDWRCRIDNTKYKNETIQEGDKKENDHEV